MRYQVREGQAVGGNSGSQTRSSGLVSVVLGLPHLELPVCSKPLPSPLWAPVTVR